MAETCKQCGRVCEAHSNGCFCGELSETERLRADLDRVTKERDAAKRLEPYCDRLAADLALHEEAEQERPRALLIQDLALSELALDAARAETARLREERDAAVKREFNVSGMLETSEAETKRLRERVEATRVVLTSKRILNKASQVARALAALTSDPEPKS
jgi:hypothetical protein